MDDRVTSNAMVVWEWCCEVYLQHGFKISFPKNTDIHKTYQWRYLISIVKKFIAWGFDDDTSKKFISIAVSEAKKRRTLQKGLAALHQSDMLEICYKKLDAECKDNVCQLESLDKTKQWLDNKIGSRDCLQVLLSRVDTRSLPNIIIWHQSSHLSNLYVSLSKSCFRAIMNLQSNKIEARMLPTLTSLYLLRSDFISDVGNLKKVQTIFGNDWKKS